MRWSFAEVLFLLTFNLVLCAAKCPLCIAGERKLALESMSTTKPEVKSEDKVERKSEDKSECTLVIKLASKSEETQETESEDEWEIESEAELETKSEDERETESEDEGEVENKPKNKRQIMDQGILEIKKIRDVNRYSKRKLSPGYINKNTIEKPEYSNNIEPLVENRSAEHFISVKKNCVGCEYGSSGFKRNDKHIGCICALFTTSTPFVDDIPLISKTFHNVSCHRTASQEDSCTSACLSLALSYYKVKDNMICSHASNATNLTAFLHTKVCGDKNKWTFTGLSTNKPICCNMGKSVKCKNTEIKYGASEIPNFPLV